jgi:hypothetical protein
MLLLQLYEQVKLIRADQDGRAVSGIHFGQVPKPLQELVEARRGRHVVN